MTLPPLVRAFVDRFREANLLVFAAAVAYQILSALPPVALCLLALAGFFSLEEEWTQASLDLRPSLSPASFEVVDSTVRAVLREKRGFWLTAGVVIALWQLSGAMRAAMKGLSEVYGSTEDRPLGTRLRISLGLAAAAAVLVGSAVAMWRLAPVGILRWPVILGLLLVLAAAIIRYAPATRQPWHLVSLGSGLSVGAWLLASGGFYLYAKHVADYGSAFGAFAAVFVAAIYVYLTSIALMSGATLDAVLRDRDDG